MTVKKLASLCALLLCLSLCLCSCSAVLSRIFGSGDGTKSPSSSPDVGFTVQVPAAWVCTETVVRAEGELTYLVTCTLSSDSTDRSNVSFLSVKTDLTSDDYFAKLREEQAGTMQLGEVTQATDHQDGRRYVYTAAYGGTEYSILLYLIPAGERLCLITYTAVPDKYEQNYSAVQEVVGGFHTAAFRAPAAGVTEGMKTLSRKNVCRFHLSVPGDWVEASTSVSDYVKAISPDGSVTVSAMGFYPTMDGDVSIRRYFTENLRPQLETLLQDLQITEEGETVDFAGSKGGRYSYNGVQNGVRYYFSQTYIIAGAFIYELSFTSTAPIDPEDPAIAAITGSFGF